MNTEIYLVIIAIALNLVLFGIILTLHKENKRKSKMIDDYLVNMKKNGEFRHSIVQMFKKKMKELEKHGIEVELTSINGIDVPTPKQDPRIQAYNYYKYLGWSEDKIIEQIDKEFKDYKNEK